MPGGCIDANGILQGAGRGAGAVRTVRWRTATRAALRKWHICGGLLCGTDKYLLYLFLLHNEPIVVTLR